MPSIAPRPSDHPTPPAEHGQVPPETGYRGADWDRLGGPAAPYLDRRTLLDNEPSLPHVEVRITRCASHTEAMIAHYPEGVNRPRKRGQDSERRKARTRDEMEPEDLERSTARARRKMRLKLSMMRADRMFTFTKRGGFETPEEAYGAFAKFIRLYSRHPALKGKKLQVVAVPEVHTGKRGVRGANYGKFHIHVAMHGFHKFEHMRLYWHRALGEKFERTGEDSPGNINLPPDKGGRRQAAGFKGVYRYMAKYISKGFDSGRVGAKRYWSFGHIAEPVVEVHRLPVGDSWLPVAKRFLDDITGARFVSHHYTHADDNTERIFFSTV